MENTYSGCHPDVSLHLENKTYNFDKEEEKIIKIFAGEWYVTRIGDFKIGKTSQYKFALIKPTEMYQDMFNLEREIVVIFSPYDKFEPRSLDAFDRVLNMFQALRMERICGILLSSDLLIEDKIKDLLKQNQESQIIIPFNYNETIKNKDPYFIRNRFKKYFYTRDLFAFESPLKKDLYFFGRNDLIHRILNRHLSNENTGL